MPKATPQPDVLVLGDHPSAHLAAALLAEGKVRTAIAPVPGEEHPDRLCTINPAFFELHPLLGSLKRKLDLQPTYGLQFLADERGTRSEFRSGSITAYVGSIKQVRDELAHAAHDAGTVAYKPRRLEINHLHEQGVDLTLDHTRLNPKLVLLAGPLDEPQRRLLGLPPEWETGVIHRVTILKLKGAKAFDGGVKPVIPMSLDLKGTLCWGWLLPGKGSVQVMVEQPLSEIERTPPATLLNHWIRVLIAQDVLKAEINPDLSAAISLDLPLAGALSQEGVANRTLLVGPAGGFYTACSEDLYPNCWSALFAVDTARKALKEKHLQDALQPYRQKWGSTLGDYLRGPQQNLRFLLPLVYRNKVMTTRLAEAILSGQSVVR